MEFGDFPQPPFATAVRYTHLLIYTASPLVEQTTPVAQMSVAELVGFTLENGGF